MRILFLSQILPYPLDSGVKIRSYYTLRQLAQHHDVTLACFIRSDNRAAEIDHLRSFCRQVCPVLMRRSRLRDIYFMAKSLLTGGSFILIRDTMPAMQRLVDSLLEQAASEGRPFDAIHSDQLWMAQYALRGQAKSKVLDQHNAVYMIPKRMAKHTRNPIKKLLLEREWRKLARSEADLCRQFDRIVTVTEQDRLALEQVAEGNIPPITVIPICVDPEQQPLVPRHGLSVQILHLGTMYWPPNVEGVLWFAQSILPLVRQQLADARFVVVGKNPPPSVCRLAAHPDVEVTGYTPDARPCIAESAVFVIPLHAGGGMRVKILDAWLWGIPIVSTTIGAEGIDVRPGENILIADDAESFAQAVVRLVLDPDLGRRLATNGRRWVEQNYNWRSRYQALLDVYEQLARELLP